MSSSPSDFVASLMSAQQSLTAVDLFGQRVAEATPALHGQYYTDLIPLDSPQEGQQYAFEVDLDKCTGCKSCVAACHSLNGLDESEAWRKVGSLVGGTTELPVLQHVTTACHHCLEPACADGCPVNAYEKNPETGIVIHLDDQCIGCQYCLFTCPYEVPVYNHDKGIVRKCDMCHDRLQANEAPACVQACPQHAIRIVISEEADTIANAQANQFMPTAPAPDYTLPTTHYKTTKPLPRNLLASDFYVGRPQHAHWPLVTMLILTQLSVGTFVMLNCFTWMLVLLGASATTVRNHNVLIDQMGQWPVIMTLALGMLGLIASVLHLGRPLFAFRAILGIRRSWLSREIVAFGVFAVLASADTALAILTESSAEKHHPLQWAAILVGIFAVVCSIMVYVDTPRLLWSPFFTTSRFGLTAILLGLPTTLLLLSTMAALAPEISVSTIMSQYSAPICRGLIFTTFLKLLLEARIFIHLRNRTLNPLKRSAQLLTTSLFAIVILRFAVAMVGGVAMPLILLTQNTSTAGQGFDPIFFIAITLIIWILLLVGEFAERYLFFTSVATPRMPGT